MPTIISGEPGTSWTNGTEKVWWQLQVSFKSSCGVCIGQANKIGPYWGIPFHFGCNCRNVPIKPGETADPFVDYVAELESLGPAQQKAAIGASNWAVFRAGLVSWEDVVTRARVRDFREVIDNKRLTAAQLAKAGVAPAQIKRAIGSITTPAHQAAETARRDAAKGLRDLGLSDKEIARGAGRRIAERVGIAAGPSGPSSVAVPARRRDSGGGAAAAAVVVPRPSPPTPSFVRARLTEAVGEEIAAKIDPVVVRSTEDLEWLVAVLKEPTLYRAEMERFARFLRFVLPKNLELESNP